MFSFALKIKGFFFIYKSFIAELLLIFSPNLYKKNHKFEMFHFLFGDL